MSFDISYNLSNTLTTFLKDRKQRAAVLNGQNSIWANIETRVPLGFILGPLLLIDISVKFLKEYES